MVYAAIAEIYSRKLRYTAVFITVKVSLSNHQGSQKTEIGFKNPEVWEIERAISLLATEGTNH